MTKCREQGKAILLPSCRSTKWKFYISCINVTVLLLLSYTHTQTHPSAHILIAYAHACTACFQSFLFLNGSPSFGEHYPLLLRSFAASFHPTPYIPQSQFPSALENFGCPGFSNKTDFIYYHRRLNIRILLYNNICIIAHIALIL